MKAIENYEEFITLVYANDTAHIAKPVAHQGSVDRWNETLTSMDMKINKDKNRNHFSIERR